MTVSGSAGSLSGFLGESLFVLAKTGRTGGRVDGRAAMGREGPALRPLRGPLCAARQSKWQFREENQEAIRLVCWGVAGEWTSTHQPTRPHPQQPPHPHTHTHGTLNKHFLSLDK